MGIIGVDRNLRTRVTRLVVSIPTAMNEAKNNLRQFEYVNK